MRKVIALTLLLFLATCSGAPALAQVAILPQVRNLGGAAVGTVGVVQVDITGQPISATNPLPTATASRQEVLALATGNAAAAPAAAYGGGYVFAQICSVYGSVALQVLGPDGATWATVLTRTSADTNGGTAVTLGSGATVRVVLAGTTGCAASLSRVPA